MLVSSGKVIDVIMVEQSTSIPNVISYVMMSLLHHVIMVSSLKTLPYIVWGVAISLYCTVVVFRLNDLFNG